MGEVTASKKTTTKSAGKTGDAGTPTPHNALVARIDELERKQALIVESYTFVANETRNLFSFGAIALIFDAIAEKLGK